MLMKSQDKAGDQIAEKNRALYEDPDVADEYRSTDFLLPPEVNLFMKYRDRIWNARTLDLGCGGGRTVHYLRSYTNALIGADYSSAMVQRCQRRFPDVECLEADARNLDDFDDGSFDFVLFSWNGIDSVTHEDRVRVLRAVHRVLAPAGLFIFSSHNESAEGMGRPPKLSLSLNPKRAVRQLYEYAMSRRNYRKNQSLQYFGEDYSILIDPAYQCRSIAYCIRRDSQRAQLKACGFDLLDTAATDGRLLDDSESDSDSAWLYYACQPSQSH